MVNDIRMRNINYIIYGMFFLYLLSCAGTNKTESTDTPTSGGIAIASDECFEPVINSEITVFEGIYKEAGILPLYSGETETINRLLADSVWLAVTSRPLTTEEYEYMNKKKLFPRTIHIATDAIALIVNQQNPDSVIGIPVLKDILTGKIKNWNDLNPGNRLGKIEVVFDHPNSSTVRYAIDSICKGEKLQENLQAQRSNRSVIDYVSVTPGAMGIIGVNWISNPLDTTCLSFSDQIRVMAVSRYKNATMSNSYKPYQAYIALNEYPMIRSVYIILSEPRNGLASGFASFVTSDRGQRIILKSGILPATQPIRLVNVRDVL